MYDIRVQWIDEHRVRVDNGGDRWMVSVWANPGEWFSAPTLDSYSCRSANLRTREEADAWAVATRRGPFGAADDAIRDLIGDPL